MRVRANSTSHHERFPGRSSKHQANAWRWGSKKSITSDFEVRQKVIEGRHQNVARASAEIGDIITGASKQHQDEATSLQFNLAGTIDALKNVTFLKESSQTNTKVAEDTETPKVFANVLALNIVSPWWAQEAISSDGNGREAQHPLHCGRTNGTLGQR